MDKNTQVVVERQGFGLGTILFIVFLVLKLTENIDWSWWWVTCPLWIPLAIWLAIVGLMLACAGCAFLFAFAYDQTSKIRRRRKRK